MRTIRVLLGVAACALVAGACVVPEPPGTLPLPHVEVLATDARAIQYGTEASRVFEHPQLRDKVRSLFGRDWDGPSGGGRSQPIPHFFEQSSPPRMVRIGGADWLAAPGCAPAACGSQRGLLLVSADGERLLARVDDGGFTHHYGFGPGMVALTSEDRRRIDAAWRAVR